jgi:hypothetical protein
MLIFSPQARDEADLAVNYLVLNKFDSTTDASPRSRNVIEKNALAVFESSYGMGAGLGSNVAFTAQGYIASSTGILGLGLCAWFARRLWSAYREQVRYGSALGTDTCTEMRKVGGTLAALTLAGIFGSHALLFVPATYLILGTVIAGSCAAPLRYAAPASPQNASDDSTWLQPFLPQT